MATKKTSNELITLDQLPIITQHLKTKSAEIKAKVAEYLSMVCTDETVKIVKAARADLNNEKKAFEAQRMELKNKYMAAYEEFLKVYKTCITDIYDDADGQLKVKIDTVEDAIKVLKTSDVKSYFESYLADFPAIDFLTFDRVNLNITKTANTEALKKQCADFVDKVADEMEMIALQPDQAEIMIEYIVSLNASQAMTTVNARHRLIEMQKAQIEAQKQAYRPIPEPVVEEPAIEPVAVVEPVDDFAIPDFSPDDFEFPEFVPIIEEPNERAEPAGTATYRIAIVDTIERIDALIEMLNAMGYHYDEI